METHLRKSAHASARSCVLTGSGVSSPTVRRRPPLPLPTAICCVATWLLLAAPPASLEAQAPSVPVLAAEADGENTILLFWSVADSGSSAITTYRIEKSDNPTSGWSVLEGSFPSFDPMLEEYADTALATGSTHFYRVTAFNGSGPGPVSNVAGATTDGATGTAPGAPTNVMAEADGASAIDVSWTAPQDAGSSEIWGYAIEAGYERGFLVFTAYSTTTSFRETGLPPGQQRFYRVYAHNAAGLGPGSEIVGDTTVSGMRPGAPTGLVAEAEGAIAVNLSWTAPSDTGSSAITVYGIERSEDGGNSWTTLARTSSATYRDDVVEPDSTYHYRVAASNNSGFGPYSNVASATPEAGEPPGAPTGLTAEADGDSAIDLSWTAPADTGSSAVRGYTIERSFNGRTGWQPLAQTNPTTATYRDTRIVPNRTEYYYRVSARNSHGTGPPSNVADASTDDTRSERPGAPTGLTASADGATAINLSWTAPADTGSSPIAGYRIEVSSDRGSNWSDLVANTNSTAVTYRHRGLAGSTTRHYRVRAINTAGAGPPSNVANATTDAGVSGAPGAPTGLSALADGDSAIDLSWTAPVDSGSSSIAEYQVEASSDGGQTFSRLSSVDAPTTTYRHTGLQAGTMWSYRVRAGNADGLNGPWSNVASATTGETRAETPGAPTGLSASADGATAINLSWTAPADTGTSAIAGYRIEVSVDGLNWINLVANTNSAAVTYRHGGLSGSTTRLYRVSAINGSGPGPPSNVASATTGVSVQPPGPPTGLAAVSQGSNRINLSWSAPAASGGSPVTGYRIEMSADGGATWTNLVANTNSTATTFAHTGLSAATTRHYRVSAINSAGTSQPSNVVSATTGAEAATPPKELKAKVIGSSRIDLSWGAPASDGGSAITGYRIQALSWSSQDGWSALVDNTGSAATVYSHIGLPPASTFSYRVQAINAAGSGPVSNVATAATDAALPDAPTDLSAVARSPYEIELTWRAPAATGGVPIAGYQIETHRTGKVPWTVLVADTRSGATVYRHAGLEPGSTWRYRVSAINSAGTGDASRAVRATSHALPPDRPVRLTAAANGSSRIDLRWTAPESDGGARIAGYRIESRQPGGSWSVLDPNTASSATEYADTGLDPGSTWEYRVSAINSAGHGDPSNVTGATTDPVGPDPPRRLRATANGSSRIDLAWNPPEYDGGAPVTGYRIEVSDNGGVAWVDLVADTRATATTWTHEGLRPATTRHYRVSGINRSGPGEPSDIVGGTTEAAVPDRPLQLVASARDHARIDLGWDAPAFDGGARITGYRIDVSEDAGTSWTALQVNTRSTNTFFLHEGLRPASTRHYRVSAINEVGVSDPSNMASATTDAIAPDPPTRLVATATTPTRIDLTWEAPVYDGGAPVTSYRIEVSEDSGSWGDLEHSTGTAATTYAHTGLQPGSTRHYRVSAINVAGPGPPSGIATATTDDPVQRAGRLNQTLLPHFAAAMTSSTIEAIAGRVEAVALRGPGQRRARAGGLQSLAGRTSTGDPGGAPTMGHLVDGASFTLALGEGAAGQGTGPTTGLGLWGAAEHERMGKPRAEDIRWDGSMLSLHMGADRRVRQDFLMGVAGSRTTGTYDFVDRTGAREVEGIYETRMTGVSPYAAWLPGEPGAVLWVAGSYAWGQVEIADDPAGARADRVRMLTGALGGRRILLSGAASSIGLHSEGWYSRMSSGGTEEMEPVTVEMQRARFILEGAHVYRYAAGHSVRFMIESGLRYDVGDATNGAGLELGGGFRFSDASGRVTAEGRGRMRLTGADGYEEWGVAGRLEIEPREDGRGVSFRVEPFWGEASSGIRELWERGLHEPAGGDGTMPKGRVKAEVAYRSAAFRATPYGVLQLAAGGGRFLGTGIRYEISQVLDLRLEGKYAKTLGTDATNEFGVSGRWRFR